MYLHIKPKKSSLQIGSCAKLAPRFCRTFRIVERIGSITYRIALPPKVKSHDVFHVSLLKKYVKYVDHVIDWYVLQVELDGEFPWSLNVYCRKGAHASEPSNQVG